MIVKLCGYLLTHGKLLVGPNASYLGLQSEASRLITSKDNPIIYEENGTVPPFDGFTADDSKLLEGHPASYFATSDHTHSQYALTTHTHTEYAPNVHSHTMDQLSGVLPVEKGGTGVTTLKDLKDLITTMIPFDPSTVTVGSNVYYGMIEWLVVHKDETYLHLMTAYNEFNAQWDSSGGHGWGSSSLLVKINEWLTSNLNITELSRLEIIISPNYKASALPDTAFTGEFPFLSSSKNCISKSGSSYWTSTYDYNDRRYVYINSQGKYSTITSGTVNFGVRPYIKMLL